jgi:hypothetical protein
MSSGYSVWKPGPGSGVTLRAASLRRYLELAAGARPFFPIDRHAPLKDHFPHLAPIRLIRVGCPP